VAAGKNNTGDVRLVTQSRGGECEGSQHNVSRGNGEIVGKGLSRVARKRYALGFPVMCLHVSCSRLPSLSSCVPPRCCRAGNPRLPRKTKTNKAALRRRPFWSRLLLKNVYTHTHTHAHTHTPLTPQHMCHVTHSRAHSCQQRTAP